MVFEFWTSTPRNDQTWLIRAWMYELVCIFHLLFLWFCAYAYKKREYVNFFVPHRTWILQGNFYLNWNSWYMALSKARKSSSIYPGDFKAILEITDYFSWFMTYMLLNFVILALYSRKFHILHENQYDFQK